MGKGPFCGSSWTRNSSLTDKGRETRTEMPHTHTHRTTTRCPVVTWQENNYCNMQEYGWHTHTHTHKHTKAVVCWLSWTGHRHTHTHKRSGMVIVLNWTQTHTHTHTQTQWYDHRHTHTHTHTQTQWYGHRHTHTHTHPYTNAVVWFEFQWRPHVR